MQAVVIIYACIFSMPANKGQLEIYETDVAQINYNIDSSSWLCYNISIINC